MRIRPIVLVLAPFVALGLGACEVQQEEPARAPDIDVEEGQLPEYDVETGDVEIQEDTVTVPEIEVEEPDATGTEGM